MIYPFLKRSLDCSISAVALILLLPLLIALMIAIRIESEGSPLFVQLRIGRGGKTFQIIKLRSMVNNAPSLGPDHTLQSDSRITRVGRFIRSTSLDELPQLWNVLKGDMSLIGPRPAVPSQQSLYSPAEWEARHRVRPGITGLAQVNGRSAISLEQQTAYDIAYASNPSIHMDIGILLRTVKTVFFSDNAN